MSLVPHHVFCPATRSPQPLAPVKPLVGPHTSITHCVLDVVASPLGHPDGKKWKHVPPVPVGGGGSTKCIRMSLTPHHVFWPACRDTQPALPGKPFAAPHVSCCHAVDGGAPLPLGQPDGYQCQHEPIGLVGPGATPGGDGGGGEGRSGSAGGGGGGGLGVTSSGGVGGTLGGGGGGGVGGVGGGGSVGGSVAFETLASGGAGGTAGGDVDSSR